MRSSRLGTATAARGGGGRVAAAAAADGRLVLVDDELDNLGAVLLEVRAVGGLVGARVAVDVTSVAPRGDLVEVRPAGVEVGAGEELG